ncbi:MAG: XRE family transcriptional regulator [Actinobacteria bacterium]|nr:XRE family transcriptional regulator [Actinomycetota bacterium]
MSGSKKFSKLKADLYERSPESRQRVAEKVAELTEELGLAELRSRMQRTQTELGELIGTSQSGVSRLERQRDILVSTLREYVVATGGRLRIVADYPDRAYEIRLPVLGEQGAMGRSPRSFHVVWQDPHTRQLVHVGRLRFTGEKFLFAYTPEAELHAGFEPFCEFPDLRAQYESEDLFPFFADRIVSSARLDYDSQLDALGLTREEATPVELLARSWGQSPHDTIQIVPEPQPQPGGAEWLPFLVSGVSHAHEDAEGDTPEAVTERVASLQRGQRLEWRDEPANPFNDRAIRLEVDGCLVGWIPDYLLDYVHKKRNENYSFQVMVERANGGDRPWHLRLLCRLEVVPS